MLRALGIYWYTFFSLAQAPTGTQNVTLVTLILKNRNRKSRQGGSAHRVTVYFYTMRILLSRRILLAKSKVGDKQCNGGFFFMTGKIRNKYDQYIIIYYAIDAEFCFTHYSIYVSKGGGENSDLYPGTE